MIILVAFHQDSPKQSRTVSPLKKEKRRKEKESDGRKQTRRKRKKHAGMFPQFLGGWVHCQLQLSLCFWMHVHPPTLGLCLILNTWIWTLAECSSERQNVIPSGLLNSQYLLNLKITLFSVATGFSEDHSTSGVEPWQDEEEPPHSRTPVPFGTPSRKLLPLIK